MSTVTIPASLQSFVEFLQAQTQRVPLPQLRQQLTGLSVTVDDLKPFAIFDDERYRRNRISIGKWHELLCICWKSGQRSLIHDHAESTCGVRVMEGIATETRFERSPCGQVKPVGSEDMPQGLVCCTQDDQVHQVSNLQKDSRLITLHVYSPPLRSMDTYSITGESTGVYFP